MNDVKSLFEPVKIGRLELKNRIYGCHGYNLHGDGFVTERLTAYHTNMAREGVP